MIESVPFIAASRVRATGASANSIPRAAQRAARSRASPTGAVLRSTMQAPLGRRGRSVPQTAATSGPPGSDRNTTSASPPSVSIDCAARTPSAARRFNGAGSRSSAMTGAPLFAARLRHIGSPMTPSPTNPSGPDTLPNP